MNNRVPPNDADSLLKGYGAKSEMVSTTRNLEASKGQRRSAPGTKRLFLKGPIPLDWLTRANRLGGQTLAVAVALWFRYGITGKYEIKLTNTVLDQFGVSRWAAYRGLSKLESSGLVSVERRRGRSPLVTIEARLGSKNPRANPHGAN